MRLFLYEFVTGGGCWHSPEPPAGSLLAEGQAMLRAIAADFADFADVVVARDVRLPPVLPARYEVVPIANAAEELAAVERLAAAADWTLLIAPETGGALLQRPRRGES